MLNEADTCREFVVPKLRAVGWDAEPHRISEQVTFTDGRIVVGAARKTGLADAQLHISQAILRATPIAYPSISEQCRMVEEMDSLQSEIMALNRRQVQTAAELDALLPSILNRAFLGIL